MRLVLHIGLPKTATTTIQHTLGSIKPLLAEAGLCYPGYSVHHHDIVRGLEAAAGGRKASQFMVDDLLTGFAAEARQVGARQVLISSEGFVSCGAPTVRLVGETLLRHFPATTEVMVLCYVREPIAFATSLCQQILKSGLSRLHDVHERPWPMNLRQSLQNYGDQFGRDSLCVRLFDPARLRNGDVVADVLDAMGLGSVDLPAPAPVMNTALSSEGAQIADALAALRPRGQRRRNKRRAYKRLLEEIGGTKFVLPEEVQDRVIEQSRDDLAALREEYGIDITPRRMPVPDTPRLHPATAEAVARMIERLVEGT